MVAQRGRDFLLKIYDDTSSMFTTVAGLRQHNFRLDSDPVDVSSIDSQGQWRELLAGAGPRTAEVAGTGVFKDAQSDELVRATFFSTGQPSWQICIPAFGIIEGPFQIVSLQYAGAFSQELTFEISLVSAGVLNFIAASP